MKTVTFAELRPGMLVYEIDDVNRDAPENLEYYMLVMDVIPAGTSKVWGDRRVVKFQEGIHPGSCYRAEATSRELTFMVNEDPAIRANVIEMLVKHLAGQLADTVECSEFLERHEYE